MSYKLKWYYSFPTGTDVSVDDHFWAISAIHNATV